jgi:tyrosinase
MPVVAARCAVGVGNRGEHRFSREGIGMATVRKNQANLTAAEWQAFINAMTALRGIGSLRPRYGTFVDVHVRAMTMGGTSWGVHSMPSMGIVGRNFLAWHRRFILRFEQQLQRVNAAVSLPYWDPVGSPQIPAPLNTASFVTNWALIRHWNPAYLPTAADVASVNGRSTFVPFQFALERVHGGVHIAVGGDNPATAGQMAGTNSPADPLFWLHHANIDRIWAVWQQAHPGQNPPNSNETLRPTPIIQGRVSAYLKLATLGYSYA